MSSVGGNDEIRRGGFQHEDENGSIDCGLRGILRVGRGCFSESVGGWTWANSVGNYLLEEIRSIIPDLQK